ncbi:MAG: type II toxin-antitoxin system HicB family antitoxin, partial [Armatimonadetes bacterium]|nr:type II toxin-antitoxin system HicB family antitoxin [Armatimonadota bacterium]
EIVSYGKDMAEARRMALDAIQLAIEGRLEDGEEIRETEPVAVAQEDCTGKLHTCRMTVDLLEAVPAHV